MSSDRIGRPAQPGRSGRPGRGRAPSPLVVAEEARGALQEQFYRVEQFQSDIGSTVRLYAELVPDRASRTGVVPGWAPLDQRASELIVSYLELLDRFDPLTDATPLQQHEAANAFGQLTPQLGYLGNDMEGYLERFEPELRKVGEARQRVEDRLRSANAAVTDAEAAWRAMAAEGYQFDSADQAIAQARIAARKLVDAIPQLTPANVEEGAAVVERLAAEARSQAVELPRRAATLRTRIPSLATRIEALETRSEAMPEAMRALRREFSSGNWEDLARREQDVTTLLHQARDGVEELRTHFDDGDLMAALALLSRLEKTLAEIDEIVDGPRDRLALLRALREDHRAPLEKARFQLRDARYLLLGGGTVAPPPWATRLDAAATELIAIESVLDGPHPDYWAFHNRLAALDARIDSLIDDYRAAH